MEVKPSELKLKEQIKGDLVWICFDELQKKKKERLEEENKELQRRIQELVES